MCAGDTLRLHAGSDGETYLWQDGSTDSTFLATDSGYYFVRVTIGACIAYDSVYIGLSSCSQPAVSLASSDTLFCGKECLDFYDLSTNNPTSWQWFFPGADSTTSNEQNPTGICYNAYGSFDVTLIACNGAGCDSLHLVNFINEFQPPPVPAITINFDTLFSTTAYSYQWYNGSGIITGATNQYYVFTQLGSYYVIISDSNGCASSSVVIYTDVPEIHGGDHEIFINPNPNAGHFEVLISDLKGKIDYCNFYDVTGRMLFNCALLRTNRGYKIDLPEPANGIYFMRIKMGNQMWNKKIVVNR
jgi:hypothetical protein